jgi:1,4-dihydroxy-2-naphthoate octaprenyltransferase
MTNFRALIRLSRPLYLLFSSLTYILGVGINHYLGRPLRLETFGFGLLLVLSLQVAAFLLAEYFRLLLTPLSEGETPRQRELFRTVMLQVSAAALVLAAAVTFVLIYARLLHLTSAVLLLVVFLFLVAYAVPPLRLSESGYGELVLAVYFATLLPAFSFLLQQDGYHRLLAMTTFPLTLLVLAYLLVVDFPAFAVDQKLGRRTLLTRLTWQRAIPVHHLLILMAFLLFAAAPILGFPWGLFWPVFLALPFAGFQIFWLQRIANGGRTLWVFLTNLGAAVFGITVYLLAFTFWIR